MKHLSTTDRYYNWYRNTYNEWTCKKCHCRYSWLDGTRTLTTHIDSTGECCEIPYTILLKRILRGVKLPVLLLLDLEYALKAMDEEK